MKSKIIPDLQLIEKPKGYAALFLRIMKLGYNLPPPNTPSKTWEEEGGGGGVQDDM
jgi:hypothetical protein